MKLLLPAQINAPRFRKDGSCSISFDTRELNAEELMYVLGTRNTEGWILYSTSNEFTDEDIPKVKPSLDTKSPSERVRSAIFVWYKQSCDDQKFVGDFDSFYRTKMETIIEGIKSKLHD